MATRRATGGLAHPTVVPENFDPDAAAERRTGDGADAEAERSDDGGRDARGRAARRRRGHDG